MDEDEYHFIKCKANKEQIREIVEGVKGITDKVADLDANNEAQMISIIQLDCNLWNLS